MKKLLALTVVLALMLCTATSSLAATSPKITGMAENLALGYSGASGDSVDLGDVHPVDELVVYIDLYDTMFTWDDGAPAATPTKLAAAQIRAAKLTAKSTNSRVIEDISVSNGKGRIEVKFLTEYASTKELDFDFTVYLTINGKQQRDYGLNFTGTLLNEVVEVDADDGSVDISDQRIAEAQEYISKIELDVGSGVTVTTRMAKDKRVYATASRTPESADDTVFAEYKEINDVIHLKTDGLSSSGTTVKLGAEYAGLYVYDGSLQYLGKASEQLPLATKYYLSSAKLELDDEDILEATNCVEPIEPAEDASAEGIGNANDNPNTGSDDYPENVNCNPKTGR